MAKPEITVATSEAPSQSLYRDRSFWGMTVTQFMGAFNDNVFKQLVLLLCIDLKAVLEKDFGVLRDYQGLAQAIFAAPFILFSGFAGFLADRYSKRRIVVLCKIAEVGIVLLGMAAFLARASLQAQQPETMQLGLSFLLFVLFLMGTHSAFFGPAKFGILPELCHPGDLPRANGIYLMTTFLAIILGIAAAGIIKGAVGDERLWIGSGFCLILAAVGVLTSLIVRRTPAARPDLRFKPESLVISRDTARFLLKNRELLAALLLSTLFWFVGGVVTLAVNEFGRFQLRVDDQRTSLLTACVALGIAGGCVLAGKLSGSRADFRLVRLGAIGIVISLVLMAVPSLAIAPNAAPAPGGWQIYAALILVALGWSSGFFAVPLQVYLQSMPPVDQKGRIIGAMNLVNWIGIACSGTFYWKGNDLFRAAGLAQSTVPTAMFLYVAAIMAVVAVLCKPKVVELGDANMAQPE